MNSGSWDQPPRPSGLPTERSGKRRYARGSTTRDALIESAGILFRRQGYTATSVKDITTHAGLAVGALYAHFDSKRDLIVMLMAQFLERIGSIDLRPPKGVVTYRAFRGHCQALFRNERRMLEIVRAWREAAEADEAIAAMHREIVLWSERYVLYLLQDLRMRPNVRTDRDIPAVASLINDFGWNVLARSNALDAEAFERHIGTIADIVYHYIFRDRATDDPHMAATPPR